MVKHIITTISVVTAVMTMAASSARAEVNVNVNLGIPLPSIVIAEPPEFILPSSLGFYVAVGVPHDLFRVDGSYFLFRSNRWYRSPYYDGPWDEVRYRKLPKPLRRHKFERIRYYRDQEYKHYRHNRHGYKGKFYKPEKRGGKDRDHRRGDDRKRDDRRRDDRRHDRHDRQNNHDRDVRDLNPWKNNH